MGWREVLGRIEKMYHVISRKCGHIKWYRDQVKAVYDKMEHVPESTEFKYCPKCELGHILDSERC